MSEKNEKKVSAERLIDAPAEKIFDVLADPAQHPAIDGSGSVKASKGGGARLALGARFGMSVKLGVTYPITNEVVEFQEGRRIAWRHFGHHVWRYELEPADGKTRVTESFVWSTARAPFVLELLGAPARNQKAMAATLERLEHHVTSPTS